jgi:hypothetical protein
VVTHISRQIFLALDPISAMHMGLSNDPEEQYRAELMSHFILRKIPNTLLQDETGDEIFQHKQESVKYEHTKQQQKEEQREMENREPEGFSPRVGTVQPFTDKEVLDRVTYASLDLARDVPAMGVASPAVSQWRDAKVSPAVEREADLKVDDIETAAAVPSLSRAKTASPASPASPGSPAQAAAKQVSLTRQATSQQQRLGDLPSLQEMFCDPESFRFRSAGLSLEDSTAAYECLIRAGCTSIEELVAYLDDHKEPRTCTCTLQPSKGSGKGPQLNLAHEAKCCARQPGAWTAALTVTGIPVFHARKIVLSVKTFLA